LCEDQLRIALQTVQQADLCAGQQQGGHDVGRRAGVFDVGMSEALEVIRQRAYTQLAVSNAYGNGRGARLVVISHDVPR
jgi:hypothetical protein